MPSQQCTISCNLPHQQRESRKSATSAEAIYLVSSLVHEPVKAKSLYKPCLLGLS